jgi:serine-type D-Ala-D-Ala carboxypeptidase (penicillin-binding protein 5/6)
MTTASEFPVASPQAAPERKALSAGAQARQQSLRLAHERQARRRAIRRRGRQRLAGILLGLFVTVVLLLALAGSGRPSRPVVRQADFAAHNAAAIAPALKPSRQRVVIPGRPVALPLPETGEGAVVVAGVGVVASTRNERSVPVASLTKIMTAYVILQDHPLPGRSGGPTFVMTKADHAAWIRASEEDESNIEVVAGERLDERQLLQALLIPSADNIASYLAVWDAGSVAAFVRKMNATAELLDLPGTHFADASGVSPGSRSTAVDMARLASIAMENPTFRSVVDEQWIKLPVSGRIWNVYNPAIGVDGIVGVKSGFTTRAQANLVTAAWRKVRGRKVLVVSAVVDQPTSLSGSAQEDEAMLQAVRPELRLTTVLSGNAVVGEAEAPWGRDRSALSVRSAVRVVGWPGLALLIQLVPGHVSAGNLEHGWAAGTAIGRFDLDYPYGQAASEPTILESRIPPPPPGWRAPRFVR